MPFYALTHERLGIVLTTCKAVIMRTKGHKGNRRFTDEAESAGSSQRGEVDDRLMNENDPPPYGAQQRRDALWEGGQSRRDICWVTQQDTRRQ